MTEKRKPSYDLAAFKTAAAQGRVEVTTAAARGARDLNIADDQILEILQNLDRNHFYKSVSSLYDHKVWMDVYLLPFGKNLVIYVKFLEGLVVEFVLTSFKER